LTNNNLDHRNPQFIQLFDSFQTHYHREIERLIPERLSIIPSLTTLPLEEQLHLNMAITNLVNAIHHEVVGSFRTNVLRSAQSTESLDPNNLFLDYLGHVAPEDALADFSLSMGQRDVDFLGNFPSLTLPFANPTPGNCVNDQWFVVERE
jgi:hypothetical protein